MSQTASQFNRLFALSSESNNKVIKIPEIHVAEQQHLLLKGCSRYVFFIIRLLDFVRSRYFARLSKRRYEYFYSLFCLIISVLH